MGVATILASRACLLVATGSGKEEAITRMIEGPLGAFCPASALQLHPLATAVLDREEAAGLQLTEYYQHVHPGGNDSVFD